MVKKVLVAVVAVTTLALVANASAAVPDPAMSGIVFENGGRIVSIKADGSGRKVLTRKNQEPVAYPWDVGNDAEPEVSPDGSKLLFVRTQFGKNRQQVILANIDGSNARTVFSTRMYMKRGRDVSLHSPVFMPGGGIAMLYSTSHIMRRSSVFRDAILTIRQDGSGSRKQWLKKMAQPMTIDPSTDGRKFLISGWSPGERQQIEVFNRQTGKSRVIRRDADEGRWSPDGSRIVFSSEHEKIGKDCDWMDGCFYDDRIYVMNADGTGVRRVIKSKARGFQLAPDFSADGSRIVFFSDRNTGNLEMGSAEIYSVGVDGSCLTWLTNGSPSSTNPVWVPGGDPAPGACGAVEREPLVEMKPRKETAYWLGPVLGTAMFEYDGGPGRGFEFGLDDPLGFLPAGLTYSGCIRFNPAECEDINYEIGQASICRKWPQEMLNGGGFGNLASHKGALVMWGRETRFMGETFLDDTLVLTGRKLISLGALLPESPRKVHERMLAAIRPTGSSQPPATLPAPVVSRSLTRKAGQIFRASGRGMRRAEVAERFDVPGRAVSSWKKFHVALAKFRQKTPVRELNCR